MAGTYDRWRPKMNQPEKVFPIAHIHYEDEIGENGKIVVPDEVQDAIRTLIRWSGDDFFCNDTLTTQTYIGQACR